MDLTDVLQKCMQVTHLNDGTPTRVKLNPPVPEDLLKGTNIPDQYRSFLALSNGAHLFPWIEDRGVPVGGVRLLPIEELDAAQDVAYMLEPECERRFYIIGDFNTTGNHLGMARDGSLWFLDHEYGPSEWYEGKGSWFAAPDLVTFLLTLAEEKGRWWFLPNQS